MRTASIVPALGIALALALLAAGCSGNGNRNNASFKPVNTGESADMAVKNAVESRATLSSITGKGVMRIVDQPNKFGLTVNADLVADQSDRLRIRADKLAGAIQAFDVVMLGDDIGFYIPTQRTLYHGKVQDLNNFSFRFDPDEVLRQMLRPETSLLLKRWRYAVASRDDPNGVVVGEEDVPDGRPRMRLAINQRTGMILTATQLDARGEPYLVRRYDDYRGIDRGRRDRAANEPVFPYLMSFSWPRERRSMEMQFKTVDGDAVVVDEDFDIATSADTRYMPLTEARMDPEMGDEPLVGALPDSGNVRAM